MNHTNMGCPCILDFDVIVTEEANREVVVYVFAKNSGKESGSFVTPAINHVIFKAKGSLLKTVRIDYAWSFGAKIQMKL